MSPTCPICPGAGDSPGVPATTAGSHGSRGRAVLGSRGSRARSVATGHRPGGLLTAREAAEEQQEGVGGPGGAAAPGTPACTLADPEREIFKPNVSPGQPATAAPARVAWGHDSACFPGQSKPSSPGCPLGCPSSVGGVGGLCALGDSGVGFWVLRLHLGFRAVSGRAPTAWLPRGCSVIIGSTPRAARAQKGFPGPQEGRRGRARPELLSLGTIAAPVFRGRHCLGDCSAPRCAWPWSPGEGPEALAGQGVTW